MGVINGAEMSAKLLIQVDSQAAVAQLRNFGQQSHQILSKLEADLMVIEERANLFAKSQALIQQVGLGLMAAGAAGLYAAKSMVTLAGRMEQAEISFTTLLHSTSEAKAMVRDLAEFAATTPFEFMGLQETAKKMIAFGFEAESLIPTMRTLGDTTSALGTGNEGIDRISRAFGQMMNKGKASGEELRQLTEAMIPVSQILQQELNLTGAEVAKIGEEGMKADTVIKALMHGLEIRFGGGMEAQAGTWQQVLSNAADSFQMVMAGMGQGLLGPATKLVGVFTGLLDIIKALDPQVQALLGSITGFGSATLITVGAVLLLANGMSKLKDTLVAGWQALVAFMRAASTNPYVALTAVIIALVGSLILLNGWQRKNEESSLKLVAAMKAGGTEMKDSLKETRQELSAFSADLEKAAIAAKLDLDPGKKHSNNKVIRWFEDTAGGVEDFFGYGLGQKQADDRKKISIQAVTDALEEQKRVVAETQAELSNYTQGSIDWYSQYLAVLGETSTQYELLAKQALLAGDTKAFEEAATLWSQNEKTISETKKAFEKLNKEQKQFQEDAQKAAEAAEQYKKLEAAINDANAAMQDIANQGYNAIAEATRNLEKAKQNYAKAVEEYDQSMADSLKRYQDDIEKAYETEKKTVDDAKDKWVEAYEKRKDAVKDLADEVKSFGNDLLDLEDKWSEKSKSAWEKVQDFEKKEYRRGLSEEEVKELEAQDRQFEYQKLVQEARAADRELTSASEIYNKNYGTGRPDPNRTEAEKMFGEEKIKLADLAGKASEAARIEGLAWGQSGGEAEKEKSYAERKKEIEDLMGIEKARTDAAIQLQKDKQAAEDEYQKNAERALAALQSAYDARMEAEYRLAEVVDEVNNRLLDAFTKAKAAVDEWNTAYPNDQKDYPAAPGMAGSNARHRPGSGNQGLASGGGGIYINVEGSVYDEQAFQQKVVDALRDAGYVY